MKSRCIEITSAICTHTHGQNRPQLRVLGYLSHLNGAIHISFAPMPKCTSFWHSEQKCLLQTACTEFTNNEPYCAMKYVMYSQMHTTHSNTHAAIRSKIVPAYWRGWSFPTISSWNTILHVWMNVFGVSNMLILVGNKIPIYIHCIGK